MKYKHSDKKGYTPKLHREYIDIYSSNTAPKGSGYIDISSGSEINPKEYRISWGKIFSFILCLIMGLAGCAMIYIYRALHSFNYNDLNSKVVGTDDLSDLVSDSMVLNVLLIGSDSMSVGDGGRSDSVILMSLDARHKKIKFTSLMRDIWVSIPGYGQDRLNASYALGGPKLTIETIEKNFGVLIDRYSVVDFEGFSKIIETLGGIDINLTADECAYINKYSGDKHILKGSGVKHLTGLQALHYSRDRNSIGSDYDRTSRQRVVLKTIVDKLKTANVAQITELISTLGPLVTTDFKTTEVSRVALHSLTYLNYAVEEFRLPTDDNVRNETYSQKMVLVINDPAKAKNDLYKFIYETEPKNDSEASAEYSASQTKKSASKSSESSTAKTNSASHAKSNSNMSGNTSNQQSASGTNSTSQSSKKTISSQNSASSSNSDKKH